MNAATAFGLERSGVYRAPAAVQPARERAESAGLAWFTADLKQARGKAELLAALASAVRAPSGFGMNWDALADSLGDLSWHPARGYVLHLANPMAAKRALDAEGATLLEVLREAAREWRTRGKPFIVLVDGADLPAWPEVK